MSRGFVGSDTSKASVLPVVQSSLDRVLCGAPGRASSIQGRPCPNAAHAQRLAGAACCVAHALHAQ